MPEKDKEKRKIAMQGKHKGKDNPAWKGGKNRSWAYKLGREKIASGEVCNKCGSNENLEVHHKDKNPQNNVLENLKILCRHCHRIEHIAHLIPFQYKKGENQHTKNES